MDEEHPQQLHPWFARLGPARPDDLGVMYDPDTPEGQAAVRAYRRAYWERCRQADEAWARQYPGVEFRRLTERLTFTPGDDEHQP